MSDRYHALLEENERLRAEAEKQHTKARREAEIKWEYFDRIEAALALHELEPEWRNAADLTRGAKLRCMCGKPWDEKKGGCQDSTIKALQGESDATGK